MSSDDSTIVTRRHWQRTGRGSPESTSRLQNRTAVTVDSTKEPESRGTEAVRFGGSELRDAFRRVRQDFVKQSNEVISLTNEKSALLQSAQSITDQQAATVQKLQDLMTRNGPAPETQDTQERFRRQQAVSQEVEEEIAAHNLEAADQQQQSLHLGARTLATYELKPLEYRASTADVSSPEGVRDAARQLEQSSRELQRQQQEQQNVRASLKQTTKAAVDEMQSYADLSINSVSDAAYAAQGIADQIETGGAVFISAHNGPVDADRVQALLDEEQ